MSIKRARILGLLTLTEAAVKVGVSAPTLTLWIREGLLSPSKREGKTMYFEPEEIRRVIHKLETPVSVDEKEKR